MSTTLWQSSRTVSYTHLDVYKRQGVTIQVDDQVVTGVNMDNFDDVFRTHVLNKLGEAAKA